MLDEFTGMSGFMLGKSDFGLFNYKDFYFDGDSLHTILITGRSQPYVPEL